MTDANDHRSTQPGPICGLLLIDKPIGFTSMDVCAVIRGRLKAGGAPKRVKVGHAGTLDPLATGLLIILIGRATRMCEQFMADTKEYTTAIDLSVTNPTYDLESETEPVPVAAPPSREDIEQALTAFVGDIQQTPPAHSAMKVGGRRAYTLARSGQDPKLEPRPVRIDRLDITGYSWPSLELTITCGKGTYIRSLARDIGQALGTGGILTALRRTRTGSFLVDDAEQLADLPDPLDPFTLSMPDLDE
jgi:tRNA pseudouridine55 synthase